MEKDRRKIYRELHTSLFIGAVVAACVEVLFIFLTSRISLSAAFVSGVAVGFLYTIFALYTAAWLIATAVCLVIRPFDILSGLSAPWRWSAAFFKARLNEEQDMEYLARILRIVIGLILIALMLLGISYWVLCTFHEPLRMAVLIAVLGACSTRPILVITDAAVSFLLCVGKRRIRGFARGVILLFFLIPLAAVVLATVFSESLFGAFSPYPFVVLFSFAAALSLTAFYSSRFSRDISSAIGVPISGVAFLLGLALLMEFSDSRGEIEDRGAFSRWVYHFTYAVFDADGDGFAWLIGGDCHPFDPNAGPFGVEVSGNGYDEDCDGSDEAPTATSYVDPFNDLGPASSRLIRPKGNVMLIISDATSAKHLAMYGSARDPMKSVTRFSKKAVVFDNFFAVSNHTSVSMASILTGQYPSVFPEIRTRGWNSFPIPDKYSPLQRLLKKHGYSTYMAAGHNLVTFLRGFDKVDRREDRRFPASDLAEAALKELQKIGPNPKKPTFFGIHFVDPHHPYMAPVDPYRFGSSVNDRYDGELAFVDRALATILKEVQKDAYRDWLIIFTSDHGEAFYEHGTANHGFGLYDEEIRVPLVIRVPGVDKRRVELAASHLDLVPTILEWCGIAMNKKLPGRSLLRVLEAKEDFAGKRRYVFSEFFRTGGVFAAFDGSISLIYKQKQNRFEMYDRRTDPDQKQNLYNRHHSTLIESVLKQHIKVVPII